MVLMTCVSLLLCLGGKVIGLLVDHVSYVAADGHVVDNPILLFCAPLMFCAGCLGLLSIVLIKIISWMDRLKSIKSEDLINWYHHCGY
jgi:hypothetical protein